jgi:hypothetical protein
VIAAVLWGIALVAAVAWPGRFVGPLDGAPFDSAVELVVLAVALPALWWFHPAFLKTATARAIVALLLVSKIAIWVALPQGGWCGDFLVKNPPETPGWGLTRSWDARTIWEQTPASCSAIVARPYLRPTQFPAWAINLPYGRDRWLRTGDFLNLAQENPRPPAGEYRMNVYGALDVAQAGTLTILTDRDVVLGGTIDRQPVVAAGGATATLPLAAGPHEVDLRLDLTGRNWRFAPQWNGADVFSAAVTTVRPVSGAASYVYRAGRWIAPALILVLVLGWLWSAIAAIPLGAAALTSLAALAALMAWAGWAAESGSTIARLAVAALAFCVLIPVPLVLRNARGAWLLIATPWLALIAAMALRQVGRFTLYLYGDDALMYQRFAYRIYMERFWLEGGQRTFWNQPLYRWINGALHVLFGDSRAGEIVWDGFGLLVGAMFAFLITSRLGGFRIGLAAAVAVLLTLSLGPNWYVIGRGLTEISALMWIYLAACCLTTLNDSSMARAVLAGVFGMLGFYTRLNHLPLVLGLGALTLADGVDAGSAFNPRQWRVRAPLGVVGAYYATLAVGLCTFAARTWYYTGRFSLFAGTSLGFNAIGLGSSLESWWSADAWRRAVSSVLMLVTVQDPPRFDWRSSLVVAGAGLSVLGLLRLPLARRLPLGLALVCVAAVAGGLVVRGSAYPGRFSIHLIPVAVTASMVMMSVFIREPRPWGRTS